MRPSRLRTALAVYFGLAMAISLGLLVIALVTYLHRQANARMIHDLRSNAELVSAAIEVEISENPEAPMRSAVNEELLEFYPGVGALLAYQPGGALVDAVGEPPLVAQLGSNIEVPTAYSEPTTWEFQGADGRSARAVGVRSRGAPDIVVVAARSNAPIVAETRALLSWLVLSIPIVLLFSGVGGYLLAARALRPMRVLRGEIESLGPNNLDGRLDVRAPPDELGLLAAQINQLLARLESAQRRNQSFLANVAHQIKTPLTIVRGETTLALNRTRAPDEYEAVLRRILTATEQIARRLDDLWLLAQAEIGMIPPPSDPIEIDGLVIECCDLMRARAAELRGTLELHRVESVEAVAHEALLREALIELIENALRHGTSEGPVRVSAFASGSRACLTVSSTGSEASKATEARSATSHSGGGLGLSIVKWIAEFHSGGLAVECHGERNEYRIEWPLRPGEP